MLTGRSPYRPVIIPTVSFYEQKPAAPVYPEADAEPQAVAEPVAATPKPTRKPRAKKA